MKKFNYIAIIFVIGIHAQELGSISGFVRDEASGEPLSYANVFIKDTNKGGITNLDGYFVLNRLPSDSGEIIVSIIGFAMVSQKFYLEEGQSLRLDFRLQQTVLEGEVVDVFGEAQKIRNLVEPSRVSIDLRTLESTPAFIEPDLFRTVQLLPGVQTINDFSSALYVRGGTPDQNLIMLDGITVYNPYHLGGIFSTFNTDAIKEADFYAGGFPARYGGRMGAILNVINREGNTERFEGHANISLISSKILMEGPLPKFKGLKGSWMIAGRRTYFDTFFNAICGEECEEIGFKFPYFFYDYQLKVNIDLNQDHRLTYSRFYGDDVLDFSFKPTVYENYDILSDYYEESTNTFGINWPWGNHTNSLTWRWLISPELVARTFLATSRYRFHFDMDNKNEGTWSVGDESGSYLDRWSFDFYDIVDDLTLETEISWHGIENHQIMGGIQLKQVNYDLGMEFEYQNLDTIFYAKPLEMKQQTIETSLFIQDKWDVASNIALQVGGRIMKYSLHDKIYFDPRFGLKYLLQQDLSLKLSIGRFHQFLTIANPEDETLRLIDYWLGIPADRAAPWADHTILGLEYLSGSNWLFRAETYYKHFENLITLNQGEQVTEGNDQVTTTPFNEFFDTRAFAYGLELLFKKTAGKSRGWIGYTYAKTMKHIQKHGWYYPKYDRTHTVNIVGDITLPFFKNLHFNYAVQASSGQPFTPPIGRYNHFEVYHDPLGSDLYQNEQFLVGEKNADRLPIYFRLDLGLKQKKSLFGVPYERYLQLINVTNHVNPLSYQYRAKENRLTGETLGLERAAVPMFPFFFTVGYRIEL